MVSTIAQKFNLRSVIGTIAILFALVLIGSYISSSLFGFVPFKITGLLFIILVIAIPLVIVLFLLGITLGRQSLTSQDKLILVLIPALIFAFYYFFPELLTPDLSINRILAIQNINSMGFSLIP